MIESVQFKEGGTRGRTKIGCYVCGSHTLYRLRIYIVGKKTVHLCVRVCARSVFDLNKRGGTWLPFLMRSAGKVSSGKKMSCRACNGSAIGGVWVSEFKADVLRQRPELHSNSVAFCEVCFVKRIGEIVSANYSL